MDLFTCPVCLEPLRPVARQLVCAGNHCFDLAREGYVNLLTVAHRRSSKPGDSPASVSARRRFLGKGYFEPLRSELLGVIKELGAVGRLVDLGCGEGYFTQVFLQTAALVYGIDISKAAIQKAARQHPALNLGIANMTYLPFADETFDTTSLIFSPLTLEIARITRAAGHVVRVTPGSQHLHELKELIYDVPRHHERATLGIEGLVHRRGIPMSYSMTLDQESCGNLVQMTPMQHRTTHSSRKRIDEIEAMHVTANFWLDVFEKQS